MFLRIRKNCFKTFERVLFKARSFSFGRRKTKTKNSIIGSTRRAKLSPKKQQELEMLCRQLLKKRELISSGKFQFIGLKQIRERMGRRWDGLSKIVYEMTEVVIEQYVDPSDIFIRYDNDSYIIIFAHASPDEAKEKMSLISKEIKKRLFDLNEEEIRNMRIRETVGALNDESFMKAGFLDDMFADGDDFSDFNPEPYGDDEMSEADLMSSIDTTEVDAEYHKKKVLGEISKDLHTDDIEYSYVPLWDTKRGALTTYLCLSGKDPDSANIFDEHRSLYKDRELADALFLDKKILEVVAKQLDGMVADNKKFFVVCPVQHSTVYFMESYEIYNQALSEIPFEYRKFLLLFVMGMDQSKTVKNPYWFAKPLRTFCPHVFAEVPLRRDINFSYLNNSGVDVAGVKLDKEKINEQDTIALLNSFSSKAKALKIPQTFVFDISSLSLTTSAICAGFDFLGGSAIHDLVEKPDTVYRYHHADLIKTLSESA